MSWFILEHILDEKNINISHSIRDYVFPEKLTTLTFIENPCTPTQVPLILIIVCSNVGNIALRQSIRETWASEAKYYNIHVLFLLGLSKKNSLNVSYLIFV